MNPGDLQLSDYAGLWPAAAACLLVGIAAPVAGAILWMRRQTFLAVALPPVASASCAFTALAVAAGWIGVGTTSHETDTLHLGASALATILVLVALAGTRGGEGAIVWTYSAMSALAVLFVTWNPAGETSLLELFNGEAMAVGPEALRRLALLLVAALAVALRFRRRFLLISFDPELASVLRWNVRAWDFLRYALVGGTVSLAVHSVGFLAGFSLLLLPTVAVRPFVRSLRATFLLAPACGAAAALLGFAMACLLDTPVGPACAATACLLCIPAAAWSLLGRNAT